MAVPPKFLREDLPQLGRTHKPGQGASSQSCPPCRGWTDAAAASPTGQDWGTVASGQVPGHPEPRSPARSTAPCGPHHIVVAMLGRQVQGNVALVGWDVHRRAGLQHQLHGLLPALPGRVVQGPHAWGQAGSMGATLLQPYHPYADHARTCCHPQHRLRAPRPALPLLSLMSTAACASSSNVMSSVLPFRAAWCKAEKLRAGDVEDPSHGGPRAPACPPQFWLAT